MDMPRKVGEEVEGGSLVEEERSALEGGQGLWQADHIASWSVDRLRRNWIDGESIVWFQGKEPREGEQMNYRWALARKR